jgi:hypothetical protein
MTEMEEEIKGCSAICVWDTWGVGKRDGGDATAGKGSPQAQHESVMSAEPEMRQEFLR